MMKKMQKTVQKIVKIYKKMNRKGRMICIVGLLCIVALVVGSISLITQKSKSTIDMKEKNEEKEEKVVQEKIDIIDLNSNTRNIAVMINNIKNVWGYQAGLQDAYIVYEMIVEGGYTRLMAIYKDQTTERIGSVRSARPYYLDYALENDAIYVHFGGSDQALQEIGTLNIQNINFLSSAGYWRDKSLPLATEHTAFTSMERINGQIAKKQMRDKTESKPVLNYTKANVFENQETQVANKIYIEYSGSKNTSFEYDEETKLYKRSQNGKAHTDYVTKEQYTVKNIITYQVENNSLDSYGRQALKNIGSGTGYYISDGQAIEITWEKSARDKKTIYKYKDGTELKVNDGNTHIEIQPTNKKITIE